MTTAILDPQTRTRPLPLRAAAPAPAPAKPRRSVVPLAWTRLAVWGPVTALAAMLAVHLAGHLNPVTSVLSSYALAPGTAGLFAVAVLALGAGAAGLGRALRTAAPAVGRAVPALLAVTAGMLALTVIFPTDAEFAPISLSGNIHRYAATVAMVAMPVAGLLTARRLRVGAWRRVGKAAALATGASLLTLVVYLVTCIPSVLPHTPLAEAFNAAFPGFNARGLTERIVLTAEVALVLTTGLSLLKATTSRRAA
ncbi:hypothetical protein BIV57_09320 [Mangrovactinospora gilvigrisea]|uniref:DUF998 domain-containing protein n=1 Tax=Mangrovactinospora gilvigrisea TaxID=1428644 RepID=A0A1J7BWB3_9ACTN|nr:DUF998 domain-containing protein [Mangrovactinospora gilvigrisea]OIV37761.1 hypothetical protein BIV57_09320 [Mangrovactinospora gilvigrisea]